MKLFVPIFRFFFDRRFSFVFFVSFFRFSFVLFVSNSIFPAFFFALPVANAIAKSIAKFILFLLDTTAPMQTGPGRSLGQGE